MATFREEFLAAPLTKYRLLFHSITGHWAEEFEFTYILAYVGTNAHCT